MGWAPAPRVRHGGWRNDDGAWGRTARQTWWDGPAAGEYVKGRGGGRRRGRCPGAGGGVSRGTARPCPGRGHTAGPSRSPPHATARFPGGRRALVQQRASPAGLAVSRAVGSPEQGPWAALRACSGFRRLVRRAGRSRRSGPCWLGRWRIAGWWGAAVAAPRTRAAGQPGTAPSAFVGAAGPLHGASAPPTPPRPPAGPPGTTSTPPSTLHRVRDDRAGEPAQLH